MRVSLENSIQISGISTPSRSRQRMITYLELLSFPRKHPRARGYRFLCADDRNASILAQGGLPRHASSLQMETFGHTCVACGRYPGRDRPTISTKGGAF